MCRTSGPKPYMVHTRDGQHQVLGRLVLREAINATAVDQELIHHGEDFPDAFVARAQQHTGHGLLVSRNVFAGEAAGTGGGGGGTGGGVSAGGRPHHFYLQVLADSFAKSLPGVRRGEEQLAALAGESVWVFSNKKRAALSLVWYTNHSELQRNFAGRNCFHRSNTHRGRQPSVFPLHLH